ncbi:hypothetical protein [Actinomadura algeriensis]|uniref:Chromosome segregation ATPase n=1 Tax=Actinomadura algeriensis TaxID=1679523 RepID=A0ABR9K3A8_9ACTN|nr:hypothetical protein [Actinomadura algeriensis]MBE1537336.1 chromosome segregation ATPase [Actinomadura algeriensis]
MTVIPGLVRRAAAEAEHRLRGGAALLCRLGRDLERSADLERLLPAHSARLRALEDALHVRDAELRALRTELDSLVAQLNDRLLPRIDERIDDTERDVSAIMAGLVRSGRETAEHGTRLETADRRLDDLRSRLAQFEQRTGLWRDVQANMARLGDDLDSLRARLVVHTSGPEPAPVQNITDRPA